MPELPEVETTRRGIEAHIKGLRVKQINIHHQQLRWPVPATQLKQQLQGVVIDEINRRGKYIVFVTVKGSMLVHLGMSGSLRIITNNEVRRKHDHIEWSFKNNLRMRLNDPRRFGCVLWTEQPAQNHPLISKLGPEPLLDEFDGDHLYSASRKRKIAVKSFIMDSHIVVGVGNIYASEALFMAGIHPGRAAGRISLARYLSLARAIKLILAKAIQSGGTTLRDFVNASGEPGYFKQQLFVYGREGEACLQCKSAIHRIVIGQRSSYYCPQCQKPMIY